MDNKMFIISTIISVIFLIVKFIEMRFIDKENKPLKFLIRDAILVYFSVICGYLILEQLKPMMEEGLMSSSTPVFTDNPGF
jgi:hypothetical protein